MADYIRIQHPDPFGPYGVEGYHYKNQLTADKMALELKALRRLHDEVVKHLESIFNRVAAGESVDLVYPDGKTVKIGQLSPAKDS